MNRHKLNSINTHILIIQQTIHHTRNATLCSMIINPCLIDHKIILIRAVKVKCRLRPLILRLISLNNSYISITFCWIIHQIRIYLFRFPLIIWMQNFLRIEIRNLLNYSISTHYYVLHSIFLLWNQICNLQPKIVTILFHLILIGDCPIIEITHNKHMLSRIINSRFHLNNLIICFGFALLSKFQNSIACQNDIYSLILIAIPIFAIAENHIELGGIFSYNIPLTVTIRCNHLTITIFYPYISSNCIRPMSRQFSFQCNILRCFIHNLTRSKSSHCYLRRVILIIVNTHINAFWTSSLLWSRYYTCPNLCRFLSN